MYRVSVNVDGAPAKPGCAEGCQIYEDGHCFMEVGPFTVDEDIDMYLEEVRKTLTEMASESGDMAFPRDAMTSLMEIDGATPSVIFQQVLYYGATIVMKINEEAGETMLMTLSGGAMGAISDATVVKGIKKMTDWLGARKDGESEWAFVARAWAKVIASTKCEDNAIFTVEHV